jgi:hypothetical protein
MIRSREAILEARRRIRARYGELFDSVVALLFRHDPIGVNFGDNINPDEYEPEAETILPRLNRCSSSNDVLEAVHQEFVRWFGEDTAGTQERYVQVAAEIWQLWQKRTQDC